MATDSNELEKDKELEAMAAIVRALQPLDEEARSRALDYATRRLGLRPAAQEAPSPAIGHAPGQELPRSTGSAVHDIRSLTEQKQPKSASEMAALVGYYLANLAPESDRQTEISAADITKYFRDANFPLPESPSMTLVHARNAGYFDTAARGAYRLNPVGHNLVAHRLPAAATAGKGRTRRSTTKINTRASKSTPRTSRAKAGSKPRKSS